VPGLARAFDKIQHGGIPVIACLQGAVVGGGLELASAAHVRVADSSTFFALPEGTRGIFTGGGATVRTARIISAPRMVEMMLTGRVLDAQEGRQLGLAHYVCDTAQGDTPAPALALQLAEKLPATRRCPTTPSSVPSAGLPTCPPQTDSSPKDW